jgi:hypothetical protein
MLSNIFENFFRFCAKTLNIKKRIIEKSDERLARLLQDETNVTFEQIPNSQNKSQVNLTFYIPNTSAVFCLAFIS